jgi:hypothetical protein
LPESGEQAQSGGAICEPERVGIFDLGEEGVVFLLEGGEDLFEFFL